MSLYDETIDWITNKVPHQSEYIQAVKSACSEIVPIINANNDYKSHNVLQQLLIPNQIHTFKVMWEDDKHVCRVNTGWRVQHNNALGPYKGGTRFTPTVNESVLKFLALEQSFKNSLSDMPLGAAKGGSDFDPRSATKSEVRRFCRAYMEAFYRHIGAHTDIPAGDINVASKELGWMFGKYLQLTQNYNGALSGKPRELFGTDMRVQATGFGVIYFLQQVLKTQGIAIADTSIAISGAGNVALHTALKACQLGAKVITLSNSSGAYTNDGGLKQSDIHWLLSQQESNENALQGLADRSNGVFSATTSPWEIKADIAIPCATQNEIDSKAAQNICNRKTKVLIEGANMPCDDQATEILRDSQVTMVPGKASNAGGVILSAFEMQQNAGLSARSYETLDTQLYDTMQAIHNKCLKEKPHDSNKPFNYSSAATIAGFRRLADAIVATGY